MTKLLEIMHFFKTKISTAKGIDLLYKLQWVWAKLNLDNQFSTQCTCTRLFMVQIFLCSEGTFHSRKLISEEENEN